MKPKTIAHAGMIEYALGKDCGLCPARNRQWRADVLACAAVAASAQRRLVRSAYANLMAPDFIERFGSAF